MKQKFHLLPKLLFCIICFAFSFNVNAFFYKMHLKNAEHLLFDTLPWLNACIGEAYILPGKDGKNDKLKRTIYVQSASTQLKGSIDEGIFKKISSIVIIKNGKLLIEEYFNGETRSTLHNPRSVGKSFASTITGIAIHENYLISENQKLKEFTI